MYKPCCGFECRSVLRPISNEKYSRFTWMYIIYMCVWNSKAVMVSTGRKFNWAWYKPVLVKLTRKLILFLFSLWIPDRKDSDTFWSWSAHTHQNKSSLYLWFERTRPNLDPILSLRPTYLYRSLYYIHVKNLNILYVCQNNRICVCLHRPQSRMSNITLFKPKE